MRADLTGTDYGPYHTPYTRLAPGATLDFTLDVTADRSPGSF